LIIAILLTGSVLLALNGTFVIDGFPVVKTAFIAAGSILVFYCADCAAQMKKRDLPVSKN
jgi:hypothetical protein